MQLLIFGIWKNQTKPYMFKKGVVNMRINIKVYLTNGQLNFNTKDDLREWYKSKSDDSNILYIVDSVNKEIKNLVF